jgi:hypothetical protein
MIETSALGHKDKAVWSTGISFQLGADRDIAQQSAAMAAGQVTPYNNLGSGHRFGTP